LQNNVYLLIEVDGCEDISLQTSERYFMFTIITKYGFERICKWLWKNLLDFKIV